MCFEKFVSIILDIARLSSEVLLTVVQGVKKKCRLSWLTNSALVYEPKCRGGGCGVSDNNYSCAHGVQINFGDLAPFLTYAIVHLQRTKTCRPGVLVNPHA